MTVVLVTSSALRAYIIQGHMFVLLVSVCNNMFLMKKDDYHNFEVSDKIY